MHFTEKSYQIWHINLMTATKYMFTDILIQIDYIKSLEIIKKRDFNNCLYNLCFYKRVKIIILNPDAI